jgi:Protein of unknown function (DUF2934)
MNNTGDIPAERRADPQPNFLGMKLHERQTVAGPSQDEVAKKAYSIYLARGRPQGQDQQHWFEAEAQMMAARKPARLQN